MTRINTLVCLAIFLLSAPRGAAQVFFEARFDSGALPAGWETEDQSGNGVLWQVCSGAAACGLAGMPPVLAHFKSATAGDGYAMLNSGQAGNLPGDGHFSRLVSRPVNCAGRSNVYLQFQTAIGTVSRNPAANAILRVRSNAGMKVYRPFSMLERNNTLQVAPVGELAGGRAYIVTLDISQLAANRPEVRLEWEWRGNNEFAWLVDDVLLSTQNPARPNDAVFFESFDNGISGWTANAPLPPDSLWKWTPYGDVSNGYGIGFAQREAFIHAPSASEGAMAFNADFYNTRGQEPGQAPPKAFVCELISPPIDLSGVDAPLALQFFQMGWLGNIAPGAPQTQEGARYITSFAYSTDGGQNWSDPINVNPYQTPVTASNLFDLPPFNNKVYFALPDIEGNSDFRLKFTWAGDFYFWVIDDIALVRREARDMKANRNFFAVTPNAVTPASQLQDATLLCDVVNIGTETAEAVRLEAMVRKKGSNAVVYADTLFYGDVPVDSLVENVFFGRKLEAASIAQPGEYEAFYAVGHNRPDDRPEDDTVRWRFTVSNLTFAKEFGPTRDIAPAESRSYTYGNLFYVPRGQGFYACSVTFGVGNARQLANNNEEVTIFLNRWNGDANQDGLINEGEYDILAFNSYFFSELDGNDLIRIPISVDTVGINLEDDAYYMVAVQYESFDVNCFMLASDTIDYQATWFANDSLENQQYASVLDVGNTGNFSTIGFGYNIVPVVRLHLGTNVDCIPTVGTNSKEAVATLRLSPNPAGSQARLELGSGQAYANAWVTIIDLSGKTIRADYLGEVSGEAVLLDVSRLPEGIYIVKFRADGFLGAGKLAVQR
ncbi:MAG: T9SS type A sorting domain-containing protein [Phaeodactylibacter sp.]|nr:T9SS type A sorting domain-containing protein [Phaeodactylibacter sp.]